MRLPHVQSDTGVRRACYHKLLASALLTFIIACVTCSAGTLLPGWGRNAFTHPMSHGLPLGRAPTF